MSYNNAARQSISPWANNGAKPKSHCKRGHLLNADTCRERKDGRGRDCKQCTFIRLREFRERKHNENLS